MEAIEFYRDILESFSQEVKREFDIVYQLALAFSGARLAELSNKHNLRRHFALQKFKNYKEFVVDELINAGYELTQIDLNCDWEELNDQLSQILRKLKDINYPAKWEHDLKEEIRILLLSIIISSNLEREYFQKNIDFNSSRSFKYYAENLKDIDKVTELFAQIRWTIFLNRMIETGEFNKKAVIKPEKKTFESLFTSKFNAKIVKEIFEHKGYTIGGKWEGLSNNKSELLAAYYVLKPLLKKGLKDTPCAKIFYTEFGLSEDCISDRM